MLNYIWLDSFSKISAILEEGENQKKKKENPLGQTTENCEGKKKRTFCVLGRSECIFLPFLVDAISIPLSLHPAQGTHALSPSILLFLYQ